MVEEYLARQKLADPTDPLFGMGDPAILLQGRNDDSPSGRAVLVSVIPEVLRGDLFDTDDGPFRAVLEIRSPASQLGREILPTLEGRILESPVQRPHIESYLHVHRSGYLEAGHTVPIVQTNRGTFLRASSVERILEYTLTTAKMLHSHVGTFDRLRVGLHFRRLGETHLVQYSVDQGTAGYNTRPSFSITATFPIEVLDAPTTLAFFDQRLSHAYGRETGLVRELNGEKLPELWL